MALTTWGSVPWFMATLRKNHPPEWNSHWKTSSPRASSLYITVAQAQTKLDMFCGLDGRDDGSVCTAAADFFFVCQELPTPLQLVVYIPTCSNPQKIEGLTWHFGTFGKLLVWSTPSGWKSLPHETKPLESAKPLKARELDQWLLRVLAASSDYISKSTIAGHRKKKTSCSI